MSGLLIPYQEISYGPNENPSQPTPRLVYAAQNAAWRRGDVIANATTGTVVSPPAASGGLAGQAGPALSAITIAQHTVAGAPAATYFIVVTYEDSGDSSESNPSQEIVFNCPAGKTPNVSVASAGAPSGADHFNVYIGLFSGGEALQNASPVALGGNTSAAYPLTNNYGANRGTTNMANTVGILGIADVASNAIFSGGYPGSVTSGPLPAWGASDSVPPNSPPEVNQIPVIFLTGNLLIEINLSQAVPYYPTLDNTKCGLTLDAASGFWYADPSQSNKSLHLLTAVSGAPTVNPLTGAAVGSNPGSFGDLGVRMLASFDPTFLA